MLNPFPTLLSFGLLSPMLIRVAIGLVLIYISYGVIYKNREEFFKFYKKNKYPFPGAMTWFLGVLSALSGMFFVIGFLTQIVSIVSIYLFSTIALSDREIKKFNFSFGFYILAMIVCLSLIFSGAGAFAVDLPL